MDIEEQLPGLTFHYTSSSYSRVAGDGDRKKVVVTLEAVFVDNWLWDDVQEKLRKGTRIYTSSDLQGEILEAYKHELEKARSMLRLLDEENARLRRENEHVQGDNARYKNILSGFSDKLNGR